ncbi:MAG: hypothetical protein ACM30I_03695 [Gemmatimonas sp.]
MDDVVIARALHVLAIVHWIGGVAFVTWVILPAAASLADPARRLEFFEAAEARFSRQAKVSVLVAGLSGAYIAERLDLWSRFADGRFWWMHAMVGLWLLFAVILFVAEPLFLHAWFRRRAERDSTAAFAFARRAHWILLTVSAVTIAAAILGAHGGI